MCILSSYCYIHIILNYFQCWGCLSYPLALALRVEHLDQAGRVLDQLPVDPSPQHEAGRLR